MEEDWLLLDDLPPSVILHIFSFLRIPDIVNSVRSTCKLFNSLSYDRSLWRHLDLDHIGDTLTDLSFLSLLESVSDLVEKINFGMAVHLTDVSFSHKTMHCPLLKSINLSLTTVSNQCLADLVEKYPDLESLEINDCSFINIYFCLEFLPKLKKLKKVTFDDFGCSAEPSKLNSKLSNLFHSCSDLESIVIDSEELSDEACVTLFERCKKLKSLVLSQCQCLTEEAFIGNINKSTNLVHLTLSHTPLEDKMLKLIVEGSPTLKSLDITGCINITDIGIGYVADNCPHLRELIGNRLHHEDGCNITNVGLHMIASKCPELQTLDVNFCEGVSDIGVIFVAEHCPKLTDIGLSGCVSVTDEGVLALARHCQWLNQVNLTECMLITGKSINMLVTKCKWLNNLSLETCHFLTNFNFDMCLADKDQNDQLLSDTTVDNLADARGDICCGVHETAPTEAPVASNHDYKAADENCRDNGSDLQLDIHSDSTLSSHLHANSGQGRPKINVDCVANANVNKSDSEDSDSSAELVDVAYVNRFFPQADHSHLTSIHLSFCSKINNDSMRQLAKNCPDLRYISVRGCFLLTDSGVEVLVRSCSSLYFLDISGGSAVQSMKLTNGSLIAIANYSKSLKSLMIFRNKLITLDGMQRILSDCKSLVGVWVSVGEKLKITLSGILELVKNIDDRYVKITNTPQVEANGREGNLGISIIPKKQIRVPKL